MPLPMLPTDSVFLLAESRETPMHVGGLQLFKPPPDFAGTDALFRQLIADENVAPLFLQRPVRSLGTAGQWAWTADDQFDIEHHVRHNSLPRPGRVLELLALCSRLHGTLLDRKRPLWEFHLIEGLADGRFAIYFKIHHSLVDGVAAQRLLQNVLTPDPEARDLPAPWSVRPAGQRREATTRVGTSAGIPRGDGSRPALRAALQLAVEAAGLPAALTGTLTRGLREQSAPISFAAPKTMFNVPITGSRRFAAQSWPLERIRAIRGAAGVTVN
ncbi:MAG TPA: wax ester/triacylglycerol synthase domain-containing protein, partial [Jatrophihabitans sp.]|nr:wax ester/triacylglycerol synthase domain-containing protein [Jatrophihabitans sp.]